MSEANESTRTERVDSPDTRTGGYGGSTGGRDPNEEAQEAPDSGSGAGGRDRPVTDPLDADEALGNRTGGYGYPPAQRENPGLNEEHES